MGNLAVVLRDQDRVDEAEESMVTELNLTSAMYGDNTPKVLNCLAMIAKLKHVQCYHAEAI